jgi:hypothetical protein
LQFHLRAGHSGGKADAALADGARALSGAGASEARDVQGFSS